MKISEEIIKKYINGEDIEDYSLEELENNILFMKSVIDYTGDKNFYNLCSDEIKRNYSFVKYLILKFRTDIDFIIKVSDYCLENMDEEEEDKRFELAIIMGNLKDKRSIKYNFIREAIYRSKRVQVELFKLNDNNTTTDSKLGMGFILFYDSFNHSKIIIDYCARKIIEDIFKEYDIDLEKVIHLKFKDKKELDNLGINNFFITFISQYDGALSSYLCNHLNILSDLQKKLLSITKNWDNYIYQEETKLYNEMIEKVEQYFQDNNSIFTETIIYYIAKKLGILEKLIEYDNIGQELVEMILEDLDSFVEDTISTNFNERIHYNNVKNIMISTLLSKRRKSHKDPCRILNQD